MSVDAACVNESSAVDFLKFWFSVQYVKRLFFSMENRAALNLLSRDSLVRLSLRHNDTAVFAWL